MAELIRSVSEIRGIWGKSLLPATALKYAAAFGMLVNKGKVILGRDTRTTSEALNYASIAGLASVGCEVYDIGVCSTPSCQLMVKQLEADGGVMITAGHEPANWNGLKFINSEGEFLTRATYKEFIDVVENEKIKYLPLSEHKTVHDNEILNTQAIDSHINKIIKYINVDSIKKSGLKVVIDAGNGAGSKVIIPFLEKLGCQIVKLNCLENGMFPRELDPIPQNLSELSAQVMENSAKIGIAVDAGAERLGIVSERGLVLDQEVPLILATIYILQKKDSVIVTNLSTSKAIDIIANKFDTRVIRTENDELNIIDTMKKFNCFVGGYQRGGVIIPEIHYAYDAIVGIGIILDLLSQTSEPIEKIINDILNNKKEFHRK